MNIPQEGAPAELLERFSCPSLETLFLQLCYKEEESLVRGGGGDNARGGGGENAGLLDRSDEQEPPPVCGQYEDLLPSLLARRTERAHKSKQPPALRDHSFVIHEPFSMILDHVRTFIIISPCFNTILLLKLN